MSWRLAIAVALQACTETPATPPAASVTRTDSSGVQIVTTTALDALPQWTVAREPSLSIGTVDGGGPDAFSMIIGALRMPDGSILVSDYQQSRAHLFDATGKSLREIVRWGNGPGELQYGARPYRMPDGSIVLSDPSAQRTVVLDSALNHISTTQRAFRRPGSADSVFAFGLGVPLSATTGLATVHSVKRHPPGRHREPMTLGRISFDGSTFEPFATIPGYEHIDDESIFQISILMGTEPFHSFSPQRGFLGSSDKPSVDLWRTDGRLTRSIRWEARPDSVTDADRRAAFVRESTNLSKSRELNRARPQFLTSRFNKMREAVGPVAPYFNGLVQTEDGGVWILRRPRPWLPDAHYLVADSTGAIVARIQLPPRFLPYQIGPDWVLGRALNEDDVGFVQLLQFSKSSNQR